MARMLYIEASPRKARSHSIDVSRRFLDAYRAANPGHPVETLDLWSADLPAFDGDTLAAKYAVLRGESFRAEQQAAWGAVTALADHFKSADKMLISAPMWNFGIPYRLKHYIDVITQPGLTFGFDPEKGYFGLVLGKPVCLVLASGGDYGPGSGAEAMDFQRSYLESWLRFIGFEEIETIAVANTLLGPEAAEVAREAAGAQAQEIARRF